MNYTHSITVKGQITIPKAFRDRLGLDKIGKASFSLNRQGEVVLTAPKDLKDVRALLNRPTHKDVPSDTEAAIGRMLGKKYGVR